MMRLIVVPFLLALALQEAPAPLCHDYPLGARDGRPAEPANCACEIDVVTDAEGHQICRVRHVGEHMPARCKNDCYENNCRCHPEDGCKVVR